MTDEAADSRDVALRPATPDDLAECTAIASGLPQFFSVDVVEQVGRDIGNHGGWVVTDGASLRGFTVVRNGGSRSAEIIWAAVDARYRGRGLGKRLIGHTLVELRQEGICLVEVKTLDPSAGYEPYLATHAFWLACGFVQIDVVDPLPGWQPGNPASILVAALSSTTPPG